ncbi:MAG: hypothetical protein F6J93_16980 [Oscillatoria sp. SIO1A7]|nr:hypothetical protein [Oscillatoria sp. SIO1A7]
MQVPLLGSISISASCRLTPKGAATQTLALAGCEYKSEMLSFAPLLLLSLSKGSQFPMHNSQCPMPNAQCPMPNATHP